MAKIYKNKNVFDATMERIEFVFNNADNVIFSVSGGKDSSVMVQLADIVASKMNKQYDVMYIDFEAQYRATIEHICELKKLPNIRDFYHITLPLYLRNAVSILQPKWICWNPQEKELWVRKLPKDSISLNNNIFDFYDKPCEFEEFVPEFQKWYQKKYNNTCFVGVGIRSDESLNRFRTIAMQDNKETFKNLRWTTKVGNNIYSFFPLYDWSTADIWGAVSKLDLKMNIIYELMYKNGLSIHEQRLCQPFGDDQRNGLDQFKALEYETWEKILNRVNGVNFGNIYCRTSALGNLKTSKPDFMSWQEYAVYLLESLGLYNKELELHYYSKIKKFIEWYKKEEGINLAKIPDEADLKEEAAKRIISWRRIARAIERNDFYMQRLSFSLTKSDFEKLKTMTEKWDNILNEKIETAPKSLIKARDLILNEKERNKNESSGNQISID